VKINKKKKQEKTLKGQWLGEMASQPRWKSQ